MDTGDIIRKLRKEKGITQEELAKILGVQKSAIAKKALKQGLFNIKRRNRDLIITFYRISKCDIYLLF